MILKINCPIPQYHIANNNYSKKQKAANRSNEPMAYSGRKILSNQISFGINKKNIKNYNKEEADFLQFRQELSRKLHKKETEINKAAWDFYLNGSKENRKKYNAVLQQYDTIYQDKSAYKQLKSIRRKEIKNPLLKEQLEELLDNFKQEMNANKAEEILSKMTNKISAKYNSYHFELDGQKTTKQALQKILEMSTNEQERQKAYNALVKQGDFIANDMVKLVKKRNEFAKSKGYKNFFEYKLYNSFGVEAKQVEELFDELSEIAKKTALQNRKATDAELKKIFKTEHLEPWHYQYKISGNPLNKLDKYIKDKNTPVEIAKSIYKDMGWDIDKLPITMDLFPRENKNAHAGFSFGVDTNRDVRILANLNKSAFDIEALCHELGHAVYELGISDKIPYLCRQPASKAMTEAVAKMMQHIYIKESVLPQKLGISEKLAQELKEYDKKSAANYVQNIVFYFKFEKAMYENPDRNLKKLWYKLNKKYMKKNPPEPLNNDWCNVMHFLSHPAYYQNYLRAEIIGLQLYDSMVKELGPLTKNKNTAAYIKKLFQTGSLYSENETIKRFTGKPLNIEAYKKFLQEK